MKLCCFAKIIRIIYLHLNGQITRAFSCSFSVIFAEQTLGVTGDGLETVELTHGAVHAVSSRRVGTVRAGRPQAPRHQHQQHQHPHAEGSDHFISILLCNPVSNLSRDDHSH